MSELLQEAKADICRWLDAWPEEPWEVMMWLEDQYIIYGIALDRMCRESSNYTERARIVRNHIIDGQDPEELKTEVAS